MWRVTNTKNKDTMRFDEACTALTVFELMRREGYHVNLIAPCGTVVNYC